MADAYTVQTGELPEMYKKEQVCYKISGSLII